MKLDFWKFFPSRFHYEDTYKDGNDQGILQRFIKLGEEYFNDTLLKDIESLLDLIDIDRVPDRYLTYIWEYWGFIPYATNIMMGVEGPMASSIQVPLADQRALLKYALALYKIRTTKLFYSILGSFYGVTLELEEQPEEVNSDSYNAVTSLYNKAVYKGHPPCLQCVRVKANIGIPPAIMDYLSTNSTDLKNARKAFTILVNHYLPIHVRELTEADITFIELKNQILDIP